MSIILEGSPRDRKVARTLADMASDAEVSYAPTGYAARTGRVVWYEMTATAVDGRTWAYYLRRDGGSYAGKFEV